MNLQIEKNCDPSKDETKFTIEITIPNHELFGVHISQSETKQLDKDALSESNFRRLYSVAYIVGCIDIKNGKLPDHIRYNYGSRELELLSMWQNTELINNAEKGDWREFKYLPGIKKELNYHIKKLYTALSGTDNNLIKEHIADCGNFLLMLANAKNLFKEK